MSVIGYDARARGSGPGMWRRAALALRRLDRTERYSPILCVATLLIVGLVMKTAPIIHAYLAHN